MLSSLSLYLFAFKLLSLKSPFVGKGNKVCMYMLVYPRVTRQYTFIHLDGERQIKVSCLGTKHYVPGQGSNQDNSVRFGEERTNHEAGKPPTSPDPKR